MYVVTGGGGADLYNKAGEVAEIETYLAAHHYVQLTINRTTLSGHAVNSNGAVIDTFNIRK